MTSVERIIQQLEEAPRHIQPPGPDAPEAPAVVENPEPAGRFVTATLAEIYASQGAYDEAIRVFKDSPGVMIDLGIYMTVQQKNLPFQADFVARALLKKGETGKAIAEYERLVSPDAEAREKALVHPFSRIRLAALYEAKGDLDRAVEQYEIVVKSWKGADPGLPEVAAARKKLTLLKAKTARPKGASVDAFYSSPLYVAPYGLLIP